MTRLQRILWIVLSVWCGANLACSWSLNRYDEALDKYNVELKQLEIAAQAFFDTVDRLCNGPTERAPGDEV